MIKVETNHPLALNNDHFYPNGTKNDNYSSIELIQELSNRFGYFTLLDLGCAGGQFVIDINEKTKAGFAVGIEGSDYNIKTSHPNWVKYNNEYLFTADVTKPFQVIDSYSAQYKESQLFNIITAWELIEHIPMEDFHVFLNNIENHLLSGGIFIGTISTVPDNIGPIHYHHSVFPERQWKDQILPDFLTHTSLTLIDYPFKNKVRDVPNSFTIGLKKQ